jgi:Zn-dependent protease with chaperone function
MEFRKIAFAGLLFLFLGLESAIAQEIREATAFGGHYSSLRKEADKQGIVIPDIRENEPTYAVVVTSHPENFDVMLYTSSDVDFNALLNEAKRITKSLGLVKADFIVRDHKASKLVDIELNDYIETKGNWKLTTGTIDFPIGKFCSLLNSGPFSSKKWNLIFDQNAVKSFHSTTLGKTVNVTRPAFYKISDVNDSMSVRVVCELTWGHRTVGWALSLFFFGMALGVPVLMSIRVIKTLRKETPLELEEDEQSEATVSDPILRQQEYNATKPMKHLWMIVVFPICFIVLASAGIKSEFLNIAMDISLFSEVMSRFPMRNLMFGMVGFMILMIGIPVLIEMIARKKGGLKKDPNPISTRLSISLLIMIPIMIGLPLGSMSLSRFGTTNHWHPILVNSIRFSGLIVALLAVPFIMRFMLHGKRVRLKLGDHLYDMVQELALLASIRVRRVYLTDSEGANAFASPFGTVGITRQLAENLTPNEMKAILAHEIAHHKLSHPDRRLLFALLEVAALVGLSALLRQLIPKGTPIVGLLVHSPLLIFLGGPLITIFFLRKTSRRNEYEADQLAIELTGDPISFINGLYKTIELNHGIHEYNETDEKYSTHPSLKKRILKVMENFPGSGSNVVEDPSGAIVLTNLSNTQ